MLASYPELWLPKGLLAVLSLQAGRDPGALIQLSALKDGTRSTVSETKVGRNKQPLNGIHGQNELIVRTSKVKRGILKARAAQETKKSEAILASYKFKASLGYMSLPKKKQLGGSENKVFLFHWVFERALVMQHSRAS